jgi:xanthine dehydrogenase accessory factor
VNLKFWQKAESLSKENRSFVCVTLVNIRGSAPQNLGAKMLVSLAGLETGTIGGGKVELVAIKDSLKILEFSENQIPKTLTWNLQKDIGMSCGGEVTLLFEHFSASHWPIVIFGAGHIAQALTRVLAPLQCQLTCIDSRKEWLDKLDSIHFIHASEPKEIIKELNPSSFFLSMTMGHAFDLPILYAISQHAPDCPYVGVVGSEVKGQKIKQELKAMGVSDNFISKLKVPMGLDIGSNDPHEIAISIAAELLQVREK